MKAVGIRELKQHLSRYLHDVGRGEIVLVTDRGRVVAEVRRPVVTEPPGQTAAERALTALSERGELRLGQRRRPAAPPATGLRLPSATIDRMLAESRSEGEGT